jgi:hypothetical protein
VNFLCFRCHRPGHFSADCPTRQAHEDPPLPPARGRAADPPHVPPRIIPDPPNDYYRAAKAGLGYPDGGGEQLTVACPWCGASAWRWCVNPATGQHKDQPHQARYDALTS